MITKLFLDEKNNLSIFGDKEYKYDIQSITKTLYTRLFLKWYIGVAQSSDECPIKIEKDLKLIMDMKSGYPTTFIQDEEEWNTLTTYYKFIESDTLEIVSKLKPKSEEIGIFKYNNVAPQLLEKYVYEKTGKRAFLLKYGIENKLIPESVEWKTDKVGNLLAFGGIVCNIIDLLYMFKKLVVEFDISMYREYTDYEFMTYYEGETLWCKGFRNQYIKYSKGDIEISLNDEYLK